MLSSAAALLLLSSATPPLPPEHVLEAFAEVCLDNLGDAGRQVSAAQDKFGAKPASGGQVEGEVLKSESFGFNVIDGGSTCGATSSVDGSVTFESMTSLVGEALGGMTPNGYISSDVAYWLIAPENIEGNFSISLLVSSKSGQNLATLMISRVKGPIE